MARTASLPPLNSHNPVCGKELVKLFISIFSTPTAPPPSPLSLHPDPEKPSLIPNYSVRSSTMPGDEQVTFYVPFVHLSVREMNNM